MDKEIVIWVSGFLVFFSIPTMFAFMLLCGFAKRRLETGKWFPNLKCLLCHEQITPKEQITGRAVLYSTGDSCMVHRKCRKLYHQNPLDSKFDPPLTYYDFLYGEDRDLYEKDGGALRRFNYKCRRRFAELLKASR